MPRPPRCCVCGSTDLVPHQRVAARLPEGGLVPTTTAYGSALADVVRCLRCDHRQVEPMPSELLLGEAYGAAADDEYVGEQAGQRRTAQGLLVRLERHVVPGRLLDLGCWVGFLLGEARARGWDVLGVEPSAWAAGHARDVAGVPVVQGDLLSSELPAEAFDAVVLADVLEHLADPSAGLDRVAGLLAPGGVLLLVLPDAGSRTARLLGARWWSVIPTHVQYFTRASLRRLLVDRGWEVLEVATAPKVFTAAYYAGRLAGYSPAAARAVTAVLRGVGLAERLVAPDFGDRVLVLARRPAVRGAGEAG